MNIIFAIIIAIIIFNFVLDKILELLNLKNLSTELPLEAKGIYDEEKYSKQQQYYRANHNLAMISSTVTLILNLIVLCCGIIPFADIFVRSYTENPILMALFYFGIFYLLWDIIGIPFTLYQTFVIEEQFGFNKTTVRTFITDKLKGYLLLTIIGGGLLSLIIWIYMNTGEYFWLITWITVSLFSIFMSMLYTSVIVPMFNKLTPLPEGELRTAVEAYCKQIGFSLRNLLVMDGSKRSTQANAFFSGLGAKKKIILYDTLLQKHTTEEIVAVIAHEVGHYKRKHVLKSLAIGFAQSGLTLFIMGLFLNRPEFAQALGVEKVSFHVSLVAFQFLYSPLSQIIGIIMNVVSRKHEFEADAHAKETYSGAKLQNALKKLAADNLTNLKPHPAYVFINYSHPPLLERLKKLES